MAEPCDRKRCAGHLEAWADEIGADGIRRQWLVCTVDTRHIVNRDTGPTADEQQNALPLEGLDG